ncbi:MAG: hypothetical protein C1943_00995 [Halochromatium sp.]|nr:hypothetical protein [Halochromatium sp.]
MESLSYQSQQLTVLSLKQFLVGKLQIQPLKSGLKVNCNHLKLDQMASIQANTMKFTLYSLAAQ